MNKILFTGFEPFGGESMNPAYEAVKRLPEKIEEVTVIKKEIPTAFYRSGEVLAQLIETERPDAVLCIGQAGGRAAMSIEQVAINLIEARIPDNEGKQPVDTPIRKNGPAAYFATIPIKGIVAAMRKAGVPAYVSYSAGTYVCNSTMYELLDLCATRFPGVAGGFIHVPYAAEQALDKGISMPSMEINTMTKGLVAAVRAIFLAEENKELHTGTEC